MSFGGKIKKWVERRFPHFFVASRALYRRKRIEVSQFAVSVLGKIHWKSPRLVPVQGSFSAFDQLCSGEGEGAVIQVSDVELSLGRDSICARSLNNHRSPNYPVLWKRISHARLVSKSLTLVDEQKRVCREAAYNDAWRSDPAYTSFWLPPEKFLAGKWTSIISRWVATDSRPNFAHWIYDALPRLELLERFPDDAKIIIPPLRQPFQRESLEMLGVLDRCETMTHPHLVVEDYYFSSPVSMIVCWCPRAYRFLEERLLPHRAKSFVGPKRFYIVRRGVTRGEQNGDEVVRFFESIGWGIVDTAALSLAEQMELFFQAEAICALHGAAYANLLWCRPGTTVVEIFAAGFLSGCYEIVAAYRKLDYTPLIFECDPFLVTKVDLKVLESVLREKGLISG